MTDASARPVEEASQYEFVMALVERQIRIRRKRALLGLLWPAIAPYFMLAIYVYIFHAVFKVGIPDYPVYLFAGLLPWTFFVSALNAANTSISEQTELIRRRSFSYQLLPIASVASVAVFFLANTLIFMVYLTYRGELVFQRLPYLVLPMITLALFTGSLALALALMDVYNRDMRQILGNLLTVWFFLTPIVYRPNMAIGWATAFKSIDPMQVIIGEFRDVFVYGKISYPLHYVETLLVTLILFLIVNRIFKRLTQNLAADV